MVEIVYLVAVADELESHIGVHEGDSLKLGDDVCQFCLVRLQKFSSCRHIEEEVVDREVAAFRACHRFLRL